MSSVNLSLELMQLLRIAGWYRAHTSRQLAHFYLLGRARCHPFDRADVHSRERGSTYPVQQHAEQHRQRYHHPHLVSPGDQRSLRHHDQTKHYRGEPPRPKPAHKQHRNSAQVRPQQGKRHRQHANHGEAEEGIHSNLPAQRLDQSDHQDTKDKEHAQVEQLPFGFGKPDQLLTNTVHGRSYRQTTDEGRDEAVSSYLVGKRPGDQRQRKKGEASERSSHPLSLRSPVHKP